MAFEILMASLEECVISEDQTHKHVSRTLKLLFNKLSESSRSDVKRCKERCLEEAIQLLKQLSELELRGLDGEQLLLLIRVLLSLQLQMPNISTACRKVDQMLQHLAKVDQKLVFTETLHRFNSIVQNDQVLTLEDLQRVCMLLEDSKAGREAWRESYLSMLDKVSKLFPTLLQNESLKDGPLCYATVKMCLQIFQLLPAEVSPLVWEEEHRDPAMQKILQALMDITLGQSCNRDIHLLAGTAVAMLINTASERKAGGVAAWGLLQLSNSKPWVLTVGALQVKCVPVGKDGVDVLTVVRGLLTCCRPHILLSPQNDTPQTCFLLEGLFPLVYTLCEEKRDLHYFGMEVLTLWLKRVKEHVTDLWNLKTARLLSENSSLLQQLIHVIWTNAESPVEGVPEFASGAFVLLLSIYEMESEHFNDKKQTFYVALLQRIMKLPSEAKAKYRHLSALLLYLDPDMVLDRYPEIPSHILKCLSTNHLSPCGAELYKCLIQQQRKEFVKSAPRSELDLAGHWAKHWRHVLLVALTSDVSLLQNNSSTNLLPCTFQVFPSAVDHLLASLDPHTPGHLHAWACILSSYRAITGFSSWAVQGSSNFETLQLALGSADDKIRLAALNLLCCSSKTKDAPSKEELAMMKTFLPQNLNCESSPFRQHLQAGVRKFLVRIRDGCLAHLRGQKGKKKADAAHCEELLEQGIGFVEWLGQLPYLSLAPGHSYQRKKTALLLLSTVLETCTDTWRPDKKKGQPPANIGSLIACARKQEQWDFFCRTKQLVLIVCLEDSTNEIRELASGLLLRFFPPSFPADVTEVLSMRSKQLLCCPRVQEAQMGALMIKVLLWKSEDHLVDLSSNFTNAGGRMNKSSRVVGFLVSELEEHYETAKADMMLAARTKPIHGVVCALQRCLLELPNGICGALDQQMTRKLLNLLENITLLLLAVLYGDRHSSITEEVAPPSFCDMGNAIRSLISEDSDLADADECVLLSEEHSLVLTCCWVSLKEIGILLGSLVEKVLKESKQPSDCLLTKHELIRASWLFENILLKCRHWGAVEGCSMGFVKFCSSLLASGNPELIDIPTKMLKHGLQVVQCPRSTSVTRRAAGLPMLILSVVSAEEASKTRPLLKLSMQTLMETAGTPFDENWDQKLDLPQVCAVHTLQALLRGAGLGAAVLQFAPAVAILSLTLLSSNSWAMRNAALQLYSSLCSRMLGQRSSSDEAGLPQHSMSPAAFFFHYDGLHPFLLGELRTAAQDLHNPNNKAKLLLQPSLFPILTLLAQLQPGIQDSAETLSDFVPPLLQLSASPIYSVRVMASKALVAMTPASEYMKVLIKLVSRLPGPLELRCHNQLHGQLLQIKAMLEKLLPTHRESSDELAEVLNGVRASLWMATGAQRCPLIKAVYIEVANFWKTHNCENFASELREALMEDLRTPQQNLKIGFSSFHQRAVRFLCSDLKCACEIWDGFSAASVDVKLALVTWILEGKDVEQNVLRKIIEKVLQSNLKEALLSRHVAYRTTYLAALVAVTSGSRSTFPHRLPPPAAQLENIPPESLDLLLRDLKEERGGPDYLSQALHAASLLLALWTDSSLKTSMLQRWRRILEGQRVPEAPEVLRLACGEALCVAGAALITGSLMEQRGPPTIPIQLIDTGLHLLQDQSHQVRQKAARFASLVHHHRRGENHRNVYLMQVNQALPNLMGLLMEEFWDSPRTLNVLLTHLPPSDLRSVLTEASAAAGCSILYEQDEANVFAEPSVMCATVLPHLLEMVEKSSQSSLLAESLVSWAEEDSSQILDNMEVCKKLHTAETLTPTWLSLLKDPRFHTTLCSLLTKATFLLRLLRTSKPTQNICDVFSTHRSLQDVCGSLVQSGVHFHPALAAALSDLGVVYEHSVRTTVQPM